MGRLTKVGLALLTAALPVLGAGCGDDEAGPSPNPLHIDKAATKSGDQQTGLAGELLSAPLRVVVTRDDEPVEQVTVRWSTPDGGSFSSATSVSDAFGIATSAWTLGPTLGPQTARASITDAVGSPLEFTATASDEGEPPPPPVGVTVQVVGPPVNRFTPASVTITAGQSVKWVWPEGSQQHNVTPDAGGMPAGEGPNLFDGPHEYTFTFSVPGTYEYHCSNHGAAGGVGMSGVVIVQPAL